MRYLDTAILCAAATAGAALALASCGFDETEVPALPDNVLHFGAASGGGSGNGNGNNGGGGGGADCKRAVPTLADFGASDGALTGAWARRLVMKSERETRGEGAPWYDSTWTVYELVTVSHQGAKVREVVEVCAITMPVIDGALTGFPTALIKNLPILAEEGEFFGSGQTGAPGSSYKNPTPLVRLYGLSPAAATKAWEPCKSYFDPNNLQAECPLALWPEIVDMDCDGNIGVTLDMTVGSAPTEQVYMVQRDEMTRKGAVKTADRIAGDLEFTEHNANIGSTKAMLKSNPPSRPAAGATFSMVRLPAGSACAAVQGAAFDE